MVYRAYTPPLPLGAFVENLWYWEGERPSHAKDTIMASGRMAILINLKDDFLCWYDGEGFARRNCLRGVALCGPHAGSFAIDAHQVKMMGAQFRAGGAWPFLGPAASEFRDRHLSLHDLWGGSVHVLHERLVDAPTVAAKFAVLEAALLAAAPCRLEHHSAVAMALQRFARMPQARPGAIAEEMGLSEKRFIRLFAREVGFTPKLYQRVVRFQRLLERAWRAGDVDWAEMAAAHGYYDQSHLIRDFRQFSGFTPAAYHAARGPHLQHVPLSH